MKILYIGSERTDAQAVATALRDVDQAVTISWATGLEHAARWLQENRDLAALVVDAQSCGGSWPSIATHLRALALHPAVVVIVPEGTGLPVESLLPSSADYITRNHSLFRDLPNVVTRAIARAGIEQKLAHATAALQEAEERHRTAMAAAAEQLAKRQAQYDIGMARAAATWEMVDEQLRAAAVEVQRARQSQAAAAADVDRLSRRETELASQLAEAAATRAALERRIAEAEAAADAGNARAVQERLAAAEQLARQQGEHEARIAEEADNRRRVEDLLARTVSAREDAEQQHASAMADATARSRELESAVSLARQDLAARTADLERLTKRETDLTSELADAAANRADLERRLAATEAAFDDASTRAARERLAASKKAAEREAELDAGLAAATRELAERQAQFDREVSQLASDRDRINGRVSDLESALAEARRDHQSVSAELERMTHREAELTSRLDEGQAARRTLEQTITDAESAARDAQQRHDAALAAAVNEHAERKAQFDRELSETAADRDSRLGEAEAALGQARSAHQSAAAEVERMVQREADQTSRLADLGSQLADVQAAHHALEIQLADRTSALSQADVRKAELDEQLGQERAARAALEQAVADGDAALRDTQQRHDAALAAAAAELAERQAQFDREISQIAAERDRLTEQRADLTSQLDEVRAARETLQHQLADQARALAEANERAARDRTAAADREADLEARLARETEEVHALRTKGREQESQFEIRFAQERLEHEHRLAEVQESHHKLALEHEALQQSMATTIQEQLQQLRKQLHESREESHRLFEQAGLAMFRCTRDGALTLANRACTLLVGRRTLDELRGKRFAAAVFEAPNVLSWLIERCLSTRAKETTEATWRRQNGGRLFVRLSARLASADVIEVVAEDLTRVRILEERLAQAHRMEAVGRFAAEVAVTCGNLLGDIQQRGRGERLFDEVSRAAGLLRQLAASGDEQVRTPMVADLNTLIRDLELVLKRVAGGDVAVHLREFPSPLNVDVRPELVERLLVNLASYGRERMPSGGRLKIELGTIVVDRHFAARHPDVRLGLHALITVTEVGRAAPAEGPGQARESTPIQTSPERVAQRSGIDFGTLQALVGECGGHLWMKVQPRGDMVAKVRLPLLNPSDQTAPRALATAGRTRATAGLFQS